MATYNSIVQVVDFQACIETSKVSSDVCSVGCQVDQAETSPKVDQDLSAFEQAETRRVMSESENKRHKARKSIKALCLEFSVSQHRFRRK